MVKNGENPHFHPLFSFFYGGKRFNPYKSRTIQHRFFIFYKHIGMVYRSVKLDQKNHLKIYVIKDYHLTPNCFELLQKQNETPLPGRLLCIKNDTHHPIFREIDKRYIFLTYVRLNSFFPRIILMFFNLF